MGAKILHIAISGILIANLFFSQVIINLLHDRHNPDEPTIEWQTGQTTIQKQGKHCEICTIDIAFNLLKNSSIEFLKWHAYSMCSIAKTDKEKLILVAFSQDRAPPTTL